MGSEKEYVAFVIVVSILVFAIFLIDDTENSTPSGLTAMASHNIHNIRGDKVVLGRDKVISADECLNVGGRLVNIGAGRRCGGFEIQIGKIEEFVSPTVCCKENV